jgi:hypothetical protein
MSSVRLGREIDKSLRKKGLQRELDGKHIRYFFSATIFTHISHGMMGEEIDAPLIAQMARQLCLSKKQFLELIDCSLDETTYRSILQEQQT